jgi:hypothetical protein
MLKTSVINVSTIPSGGKYYTLGGFANGEHPAVVDVQVSWDGLDGFDGYFKFCQRHVSGLNWTDVTGLQTTMGSIDGSESLINHDFTSNLVGIFIDKGSAKFGEISIRVSYVKQAF